MNVHEVILKVANTCLDGKIFSSALSVSGTSYFRNSNYACQKTPSCHI